MNYSFVHTETDHAKQIPEAISRLEKEFSIRFPGVLRDYYQSFDGCLITPCSIIRNGYQCEVYRIIPLLSDNLNFETVMKNDRADGFISPTLCPIGMNRGGDFFYWDSVTENVFLILWDDIENPFKLCNSVSEFFQLMSDSAANSIGP